MSESQPEDLQGRTFQNRTLRESRFIGCDFPACQGELRPAVQSKST